MDVLPDDVLLILMRHLDVRSLLTCRLVSKRIGAFAFHPHVWRHRQLGRNRYSYSPRSCEIMDSYDAPLVLRLAPCLRSMRIELSKGSYCAKELRPYFTTRCAAAELRLTVGSNTCTRAALMIRHQEALGRLRRLDIDIGHSVSRDEASLLLMTAASPVVLEKLVVRHYAAWEGHPTLGKAVCPRASSVSSLKCFDSDFRPGLQRFCDTVLARHAATLTEVYLRRALPRLASTSTLTASLLADLPNLRVLHCPQLPGMEAMVKCGSLTVLTLVIDTPMLPVPGTTSFVGRLKQLREVHLTLPASNVGLDLVHALARSRVETLTVQSSTCYDVAESLPQRRTPLGAFPMLPLLRRVQLNGVAVDVDELLLSIGAKTTPALRSVWLRPGPGSPLRCPHSWLHSEAVHMALARNPLLHVEIATEPHYPPSNCPHCNKCLWLGCHQELRGPRSGSSPRLLGVFSHDPELKCSCPEYHTPDDHWFHIPGK